MQNLQEQDMQGCSAFSMGYQQEQDGLVVRPSQWNIYKNKMGKVFEHSQWNIYRNKMG